MFEMDSRASFLLRLLPRRTRDFVHEANERAPAHRDRERATHYTSNKSEIIVRNIKSDHVTLEMSIMWVDKRREEKIVFLSKHIRVRLTVRLKRRVDRCLANL